MVARAHFRDSIVSKATVSGEVVQVLLTAATVNVYETGTTTPIAVTMYSAATGGATLANPLTSDSVNGEIEFWLDEPRRVDLKITKAGYTTRTVTVDVSDSGDEEASTDVARTFTAEQRFDGNTRHPVTSSQIFGVEGTGSTSQDLKFYLTRNSGSSSQNGTLTLEAAGSAQTAGLQIVPGASSAYAIGSQVILFGRPGANYERFAVTAKTDEFIIDASKQGSGSLRPITINMDGVGYNLVCRTDGFTVVPSRLGIGTGSTTGDPAPAVEFHIKNTSTDPGIRIQGPAVTGAPYIEFYVGDVQRAFTSYSPGTGLIVDSDEELRFRPNNTLALTLDTSGNALFVGKMKWVTAGNEQTTVGAAGGASALPATPTKYLKIIDSAGTTLVVPAYASA